MDKPTILIWISIKRKNGIVKPYQNTGINKGILYIFVSCVKMTILQTFVFSLSYIYQTLAMLTNLSTPKQSKPRTKLEFKCEQGVES